MFKKVPSIESQNKKKHKKIRRASSPRLYFSKEVLDHYGDALEDYFNKRKRTKKRKNW